MVLVILFSIISAINGFIIGINERSSKVGWFGMFCVWSLPILKGLEVVPAINAISWWYVFFPLIVALVAVFIGTVIKVYSE